MPSWFQLDQFSSLAPDLIDNILCMVASNGMDAGLKAQSSCLLGRVPRFEGLAFSTFLALRCCTKGLSKSCNSICKSVSLATKDRTAATSYLKKLRGVEYLALGIPSGTSEHEIIDMLNHLHSLQSQLTTLVLTGVKAPLADVVQASVGNSLINWTRTLSSVTFSDIDCVSFMGLHGLPSLRAMELCRTLPPLKHSNLCGCPYLEELSLRGLGVSQSNSLDLSCCPLLRDVSCLACGLTTLSVKGLSKLMRLRCGNNSITVLDASNCSALTHLSCDHNQLTLLDLGPGPHSTENNVLQTLNCCRNRLTKLDLSRCGLLRDLSCLDFESSLSLRLMHCSSLQALDCHHKNISGQDLEACLNLMSINMVCNDAETFGAVNLSDMASLEKVRISSCELEELTVTRCSNLHTLYLSCMTSLRSLVLEGCKSIHTVRVDICELTQLCAIGFSSVEELAITECPLAALDLSCWVNLRELECIRLDVTTLDISPAAGTVAKLTCSDSRKLRGVCITGCSKLTSLDLFGCFALRELKCGGCTSLNVSPRDFSKAGMFHTMDMNVLHDFGGLEVGRDISIFKRKRMFCVENSVYWPILA